MGKERILGVACSVISAVYFADYKKTKENSDFCFGLVYGILALAWAVLGAKTPAIGEDK